MDFISIEEEAQSVLIALKYRAISLDEINDWADEYILRFDKPDIKFIELSLVRNEFDAASYLRAFGCSGDKRRISKRVFGHFHNALKNETISYSDVSKALFLMPENGYIPEEGLDGDMMHFWDGLDLAESGHFGDPESFKKSLLDLLVKYKV